MNELNIDVAVHRANCLKGLGWPFSQINLPLRLDLTMNNSVRYFTNV